MTWLDWVKAYSLKALFFRENLRQSGTGKRKYQGESMAINLSFIGMILVTIFLAFSCIILLLNRMVTKKPLQQPSNQRTIEIMKKEREER